MPKAHGGQRRTRRGFAAGQTRRTLTSRGVWRQFLLDVARVVYRPGIDDETFLRRTIELARDAMRGNRGGPFGAVIVLGGAVVGEGGNGVLATNDPTAHAEIVAIRAATAKLRHFSLRGGTIYASSEPCPMCLAAIYWARLDRIVYANARDVAASAGFDDTFFYEELALDVAERAIPMRRVGLPDAEKLFEEWTAKPDKTAY